MAQNIPKHLYQPPIVGCPLCGSAANSPRYNKDGTATYRCNFIDSHSVYCFKAIPYRENTFANYEEVDFKYQGKIPDDIQAKIKLADEAARIRKELKSIAPAAPPQKAPIQPTPIEVVSKIIPHELFGCKESEVFSVGGMYYGACFVRTDGTRVTVKLAAINGKTVKVVSDDDEFSLIRNDQHVGEVMFLGSKGLVKRLNAYGKGLRLNFKKLAIALVIGDYGELTVKFIGRKNIGSPSGKQEGIMVVYDFVLK